MIYRFLIILMLATLNQSCSNLSNKDNFVTAPIKDRVHFPTPTGNFKIGLKRYFFKDPNRQDPYIEEKSPREISVNLYYPIDKSVSSSQAAEAPYINTKMVKYFQDEFKKNGLDETILKQIATGIFEGTEVSKKQKKYPLIVLSHGNGGAPEFYTIVIRNLVSHGFIVAAINHTYTSFASVLSDGSVKLGNPIFDKFLTRLQLQGEDFYGSITKINIDDITQVIDELAKTDLKEHIDFDNMGMIGHSLGGMAVTYACLNSPKCKSGVNLDGPLLGGPKSPLRAGNLSGDLSKPFLFLIGKYITSVVPKINDPKYKNKTILEAIYKLNAPMSLEEYYEFNFDRYYNRLVRAAKKMGKNTAVITFANAGHMSFSDYNLLNTYLLNTDKEKEDELRITNQMNTILVNFFSKHLQHKKKIKLLENLIGKNKLHGMNVHTISNPLKIKQLTTKE